MKRIAIGLLAVAVAGGPACASGGGSRGSEHRESEASKEIREAEEEANEELDEAEKEVNEGLEKAREELDKIFN